MIVEVFKLFGEEVGGFEDDDSEIGLLCLVWRRVVGYFRIDIN
jgi:hypothetical protein